MRKMFQSMCKEWAAENPDVMIVSADFGFAAFDDIPARQKLIIGPMEQAAVGLCAGLSMGGRLPILYSITPFIIERAFEQIKLDLVRQGQRCLIVTFDDYPGAGPTHRAINPGLMCDMMHLPYWEPQTMADCNTALLMAYRRVRDEKKTAFVRLGLPK